MTFEEMQTIIAGILESQGQLSEGQDKFSEQQEQFEQRKQWFEKENELFWARQRKSKEMELLFEAKLDEVSKGIQSLLKVSERLMTNIDDFYNLTTEEK